jgi:hypothetical protein
MSLPLFQHTTFAQSAEVTFDLRIQNGRVAQNKRDHSHGDAPRVRIEVLPR